MLLTAGERISMALVCMALGATGAWSSASFTGSQAGIITDTDHTRAKILEMRPDRIREALDAGLVPGGGRIPGGVDRTRHHDARRGGSDVTAVALASALGADVCEIYTDVTGVFSADPRVVLQGPSPGEGLLRRDDGDRRDRRARADAALGRVRAAPRACRCTFVRVSPGSQAPGLWRRTPLWKKPSSSAVTDDTSEAKVTVGGVPDRPGDRGAAVPRTGRPRHQRRHDRPEHQRARDDRHLVHRGQDRPRRRARRVRAGEGRDRRGARDERRQHRAGVARRRRDEVQSRRHRTDVRDTVGERHQHRDDLDELDPHLVRGARRRVDEAVRACTRRSASTRP